MSNWPSLRNRSIASSQMKHLPYLTVEEALLQSFAGFGVQFREILRMNCHQLILPYLLRVPERADQGNPHITDVSYAVCENPTTTHLV